MEYRNPISDWLFLHRHVSCRLKRDFLNVLSGTYEGEQDEDEEGEDGAARAGDGSEHGAGRQEDGGGGQEEGETLRQPSP